MSEVKRYDVGVHFLWATAEKEPRDDGCRIVVMYDDHLAAMEAKDLEIEGLRESNVTVDDLFAEFRKCHHAAVEHNEIQELIMAKHLLENCIVTRKPK